MKRALIDMSSVVWTCLMAGKDREFGKEVVTEEGKKVWVNSAGYGYDNALNHLKTVMEDLRLCPRQFIFVVEGEDAKIGRQYVYPGYKAGRGKVPELYVAFNEVKGKILSLFLSLGAQAVTQPNVEADDVLGYLAAHLQGERWIVSADKDLAQCVGGDVHHYRMGVQDENPFGPFPHHLIPVYIALVGDAADAIPGARGFGEKAFLNLLEVFDVEGLEQMRVLIESRQLDKLAEDVGELKTLHKVIDGADDVYKSYELGRLWVEKVNSMRRPLKWQVGMVRPRTSIEEQQFRTFGGLSYLVTRENLSEALGFFTKHAPYSPEIALDIETSTPPESDEWLEQLGKAEDRIPVDVFGSELTGMSLTFGWNMQYTIYISVDHVEEEGFSNVTPEDVANFIKAIPSSKEIVVHNASFELPVCYMCLGEFLEDPAWHGFLPNVVDSAIMSSYVDENRSAGLKGLSESVLGYKQTTYQEVTTRHMGMAEYADRGQRGKILQKDVETDIIAVQYKMRELPAREVMDYGCDDTICTAALSNHFRTIMEIEGSWDVFKQVEQLPAYVTAKAFVDGVDFSLESMREMEKEDDVAYDKAWATLREFLIKIGFDGTSPPVATELTPAVVKEAFLILTGEELKTMVRTPSKLSKLILERASEMDADLGDRLNTLAAIIDSGDVTDFNNLVAHYFDGEPKLDLSSPKQMCHLLYDRMGLPVNIINDVTVRERIANPELADAINKFKMHRRGKDVVLTPKHLELVRKKAKADDTAIDYALAFNADVIDDDAREALKAIGVMKKVITRRNLFYKNYWTIKHWKDGKIHAQVRQCGTVTRRHTSSSPNLQQLPKKGEGVKFRSCFVPHKRNAVVVSIDFSGQELRLAAERSQDKNMLSCYIGDNLRDIHSITAAGAMNLKWGAATVRGYLAQYGANIESGPNQQYELFTHLRSLGKSNPVGKIADDLRKEAKNVNFAAQFGGQALKLSETLVMKVEDAQIFLDARSAMFPDVDKAATKAEDLCKRVGYACTALGVRRHLHESITSDDKGVVARAARQAWNMEIQGSAAEMTKLAIARLWESGVLFSKDMVFFAPIHDELVFSVDFDDALETIRIVHECMVANYASMQVPILGSISLGPNFADQAEVGDWFIPENITKVIEGLKEKVTA